MQLGSTLGANLISGSIVAMLYGAMCLQCYSFYQRSHESKQTKWASLSVFFLWLLSTLHLIFTEFDMYLNLVANFGNVEKVLNETFWPVPAIDVITLVTTLFCQCWYCHRMWKLSDKNRPLTYTLLVVIILWFSFGMASCVEIVIVQSFAQYHAIVWLSLTSVSLTTFADFYIAASLCFFLFRRRKDSFRVRTSSLLNTIIIYTVSTGLLTSMVSVSYIVANLTLPNTWIWVGEYMVFCGLYCNSLLAWINAREYHRQYIQRPMGSATLSQVVFRGIAPGAPPAQRDSAVGLPVMAPLPIEELSIVHSESDTSGDDSDFSEKSRSEIGSAV